MKGISSDYGLAKLFDVLPQTISHYRHGRTQMGDLMAVRAARMLGHPPAPLLAKLAAERTKDSEVAKIWRDAAKVLAQKSKK